MRADNRDGEGIFRRSLTRRVVAGGALFGLFGWLGLRQVRACLPDAEAAILGALGHRESASQIGRQALQLWPQMSDRSTLLNEVLNDLRYELADVTRASADELGRRMSQRIAMDFSEERTVRLDGWVLSLAEVRVCALAALSSARTIS
jgi:Arc/MetJ-type ribon-helix-helix transcriptional regulator